MSIQPPIAPQKDYSYSIHGQTIHDPYFWLREKDNPEVIAYLRAENEYTEAILAPYQELREQLYQELKSRIKEDDSSPPAKWDNYYYYTRVEAGKQYTISCRKKDSLASPEEILLDNNQLAEGLPFFSLGIFDISPNHQILAYSFDTDGSETFTIFFKDLATGELLSDCLKSTYYGSAWANDSQTFYYVVLDENLRPYRLYRHRLGQPQEADELLYEESDPQFFIGLDKSRDDRYIFLCSDGKITSEVYFLEADDPQAQFQLIQPRQRGIEYEVVHHEGYFYILTNENAINFRVMRTPVSNYTKANWQEFIPHDPKVLIEGLDEFKDYLIIYDRYQGLERIRIYYFKDGQIHSIQFDDPTYTVFGSTNYEYDTHIFRFGYSSLVLPTTIYDYDLINHSRTVVKQDEIPGGYDPSLYTSERITATAHDGTAIPVSLVYKKDLKKNGTNPLYLYGYGAYGISMDAYFSSKRLSLIDRGFIWAMAHIRGGSELGRTWYEQGKFLHKQNTFLDFIACAEHLIQTGYTSKGNIAISGGSAGGLLIGAVLNMRPDLFRTAIANVPFVDVVNTMLDDSLPLTQLEYDEWGNPQDVTFYEYIRSYSPYDNVRSQDYPHILITAGLNDPRVTYWEPAKWTAKLRALKTDQNLLLLKTNMDAGHSGASGRYEYLKEIALEYTFLLITFDLVPR
ncbi:MAG: S9 family peptidase [Pseudanabaenaceae cyanobacterium]